MPTKLSGDSLNKSFRSTEAQKPKIAESESLSRDIQKSRPDLTNKI